MDLEHWVVELLVDIAEAAAKGESFTLHMQNEYVKELAEAYRRCSWIEIY